MRTRTIFSLLLPALLLLAASRAVAVEPWADSRLPVATGLELWLDASKQPERWFTYDRPVLKNGGAVDVWYDGSGHGRNVWQKARQSQPTFVMAADFSLVRFDGRDDYLQQVAPGKQLQDFTLFVVGAAHSNAGEFRAFLSLGQAGASDYVTGFTLDQGPNPTEQFDTLNVEGAGFKNATDLLAKSFRFDTFHTLCVVSSPGEGAAGGTRLFVDGKNSGTRPRKKSTLHLEEITVGARVYSNTDEPPFVRGFLDGELAEVLLYDRALTDDERSSVEKYLAAKYAGLPAAIARLGHSKRLETVDHPPPVQMFVPGFSVRQLPVDLNNINNIKYRHDGKLVALGYNGSVYLLSDTDGDHLEDKVEVFWENTTEKSEPAGMALTPAGYPKGNGVFIPSKGRILLLADTDGDDRADEQIIVADGWKVYPYGIDAIGVAFDARDGSVYFGLGTAEYTNPYMIDAQGKAGYSTSGDHAAVWRVAADFKKRERVCTGTRFPVALAFNAMGDLFATDQEGATWLPNGNPFDELLHLIPGRHYGFPPRHPRHLPDVIDEPSTFDYGPQHQSACGLNFNVPVNGGPTFGPDHWRSDALVSGYSRGKLFRTQLVRTDAGYVAQNQIIACLNMLCVDACVSPRGDLAVSCHSGGPDWGTGPQGKGKLYKISYTDRNHPQPVVAWAAGPQEVHIAFDRPVSPAQLKNLTSQSSITYGAYVSAGDRFETLRPGYATVQHQLASPRFDLPLLGAQLSADARTLILSTAPQREAVHYALALPGMGRPDAAHMPAGQLPQLPAIDLAYDLSGVECTWTEGGSANPAWSGWLPHLDLAVARQLTAQSVEHAGLWQRPTASGKLTLRTNLNLTDMLRPAVQPGSTIDYSLPEETVTLVLTSRAPLTVSSAGLAAAVTEHNGIHRAELTFKPKKNTLVPLQTVLDCPNGISDLTAAWFTAEDTTLRPLPLRRLLLPWATLDTSVDVKQPSLPRPELAGGNWMRGREIFLGQDALCFKCHAVHGEGGVIGPSLANLPQRDYASVVRDITNPNFAINPDFLTYAVVLQSGRVYSGAVQTDGKNLKIGDDKGNVTVVPRNEVEILKPSNVSTMPEGINKKLNAAQMKDLLTYLLTEPPHMPEYGPAAPPAPRTRAEVDAVLAGAPQPAAASPKDLNVVLVYGKQDHDAGEHDYPAWAKMWEQLMSIDAHTRVSTARDWPTVEQIKAADVMVFYQRGNWTPERAAQIDAYLLRGGGLVYIHWAVDGRQYAPAFAQRIGLAWGEQSKYRHGPVDLGFETGGSATGGARHPVSRNFGKVHFHDESYWQLVGDPKQVHVLATGAEEGKDWPLFWTLEPSKGRVFVSILGHYSWTFDDPLFRVLLLRGIAWTANEPVDRYNALATPGARIAK